MRPLPRLLASGVLLLGAAAPSTGATVAAAGTAGYCPGETGVTVVVDFTDLGGDVIVRCAPGKTGTGLDALTAAGFTFEGTQRWGTAMICRIQGRPAADEELPVNGDRDYKEECVDTPSGEAHWSYSHADNGGAWTYSTTSAKARRAKEGGFEGWRFTLNHGSTEPSVVPLRPSTDTTEPHEPNKPDKPNPPQRPADRPSDPPATEPTDEPAEQPDPPATEPTDEPAEQPDPPAVKPERPDKLGDKKARPDKPKDKPAKRSKARSKDTGLGTTTEGATVTGELPAESAPDAEEDATSGTTTLLGVGLISLLGAGAAFTAYRRRSQHT